MLKNQNIICISSIDWDFVWQGHQEIMSTFAKNGNRVLFIENTGVRVPRFRDISRLKKRVINWLKGVRGFRMVAQNLYVYSPLILPFPYSHIARIINKRMLINPIMNWCKIMEFHDPIIWTFLPTGTPLDIISNTEHKLLVYYCIADFDELADNPRKIRKTEDELIKKSDVVFVQGEALRDRCLPLNDNVHIFPFGVKFETFEQFKAIPRNIPEDLRHIKKPIIGYIGGVHRHIDFDLVKTIAERHPEWSIVFVGPIQTDTGELNNLKNLFFLGKKEFMELPHYINEFDICLIPYLRTEYTATVYPTKMNEYHALGKPVVSTDIPEVVDFNLKNNNLILAAKTKEEFIGLISTALKEKDESLVQRRISSAKNNSWVVRIEQMSGLMEDALERKNKTPIDWQKSFLRLYRRARRKILSLGAKVLIICLLLFYTPLMWFIASPLKISQAPEKTDCIVVFAGGVGASGKAGTDYEERARFAVELYKKGYARNIIFSSGFMHIFREPLIMKALAVSLGIPEQSVFLESRANNTYQHVQFSKEILDSNRWDKIILVSSPYHMLRASLVFKKVAKEIEVIYVPIPESSFFARYKKDKYGRRAWKQVDLRQIHGILHEYIGILYYYYKGWI